jgi:two-component system, NtrC family, sensor kinase
MNGNDPSELQKKIKELEAQLAEAVGKLQTSGVEIEANEGLMKFMMEDMRRIYEDLMRSQSQLMQSDKLATIGLLTAGIVHEINNPLAAVNLAFSLLESQVKKLSALSDRPEAQAILKDCGEFVERGKVCVEAMARIVGDIRMFSRSDKGIMNEESVNKVIESVIGIVWNSLKNKVKIDKELGDVPKIRCNAQQLSQVFLNLIVNASQAMEGKDGTITVRSFAKDGMVFAQVADTGCGMTDEVKKRLFEPFFTTKSAETGTGLGLSITHDIIKKHSGEVKVDSEAGKGTTFTIGFPTARR